jgi:2'-5' RNA ligase
VARYLQRHALFATDPITVTHFALLSAKPQAGGGPYVIEETYPLLGGGYDDFDLEL